MLCEKYGFAPYADFVVQSLDLKITSNAGGAQGNRALLQWCLDTLLLVTIKEKG